MTLNAKGRPYTCQMCGVVEMGRLFGPIRAFCDECRVNRHTDAAKRSDAKRLMERGKRIREYDPEYFYNYNLKRNYGLTRETYDEMGDTQKWLCAICDGPPSSKVGNGGRLVVDHCHKTGKVRALLCSLCNKGIGLLRDDPYLAERAAMYLRTHSE